MTRSPVDRDWIERLPTLHDCVHCGLCLPACPTYAVTGRETQSPRGRIAALRAVGEERSELTPALATGLDDCLVCRACESHCPSGISMEGLMSEYRERARSDRAVGGSLPFRPRLAGRLERFALRSIIARPRRLATFGFVLRGVAPLARSLPWLTRPLGLDLPPPRRTGRPPVVARDWSPDQAGIPDSGVSSGVRGTVALLRGCVADLWFRAELLATARVLTHNRYRVRIAGPACCGALHRHAGLLDDARALRDRALGALAELRPDHVVMESAGCAPALAEPVSGSLPGNDPQTAALADRVTDPLGLLHREGWRRPTRLLPGRWVVAPPCHQRHGPISDTGTRAVLQECLAEGYMELPEPELCCGAAGFYMVRRANLSRRIGKVSAQRFAESGGTGLLTGNPGCLLRWETLLQGTGTEVLHPVLALDRAYREAGDYVSATDGHRSGR